MDVYIPIQYACHVMHETGDYDHCPVVNNLPNDAAIEKEYLYLNTSNNTVDFGMHVGADHAMVLTRPAFHHAKRLYDDDTITAPEDYTKRGEMIAKSLHFGSPHEFLAAWMNEDRKQAVLISGLDIVLSLQILKKLPQWMRHDLLLALESEAMKQVFAKRYMDHPDRMQIPLPVIVRKPFVHNADSHTHTVLSDLMHELFQKPLVYKGAAKNFAQDVQDRLDAFNAI
jgi:hypothetical protein